MRGQAALRNRGLVAVGIATALSAVLLLVVLNAGASPPAPFVALSCNSSSASCVLAPGGAGTSVTFQNTGGKSTAALVDALTASPANAGFTITSDSCKAAALGPNKTCQVTVAYPGAAPASSQTATLTVSTKKSPVQSASAYFAVVVGCGSSCATPTPTPPPGTTAP